MTPGDSLQRLCSALPNLPHLRLSATYCTEPRSFVAARQHLSDLTALHMPRIKAEDAMAIMMTVGHLPCL